MSPDDPNFPWWAKAVAYATLAAFGGFMGYVLRSQHAGIKVTIGNALVEAGAAGFIGFILMLICNEMNLSMGWTGVIVGTFGWLGAQATMVVLEKLVYKKLGLGEPAKKESDADPAP